MDQKSYTVMSRPPAPSMGGRLLYRPDDVIPWITGKSVAMIGDGPSKRRYIFAPDQVITFAINKAAMVYPCAMAAAVGCHYDEIAIQIPPWIPTLFIGAVDIQRYNLGPTLWTMIVLLMFLSRHASRVYIQGIDLTDKKYMSQLEMLRAASVKGEIDRAKIGIVTEGHMSGVFGLKNPDTNHIC